MNLYELRAKAVHDAREILNRAERENRDLNSEEQAAYARADAEIDRLNAEIQKAEQAAAAKNRRVPPSQPGRTGGDGSDGAALTIEYPGHSRENLRGRAPRRTSLRPGTPEYQRSQPAYHKAFLNYLMTGREQLGLQVSADPKGGYLAPTQIASDLIKFLDDNVFMRQLANVLPPLGQAVSLGVPSWDTDPNDADWTAEVPASDISEDTAARLGKRELTPHLLTKLLKFSQKLMRSSVINPDTLLVDRGGYKVAITEEKAFLTGDGDQKPLGVFVASNDGVPASRDVTAASATAVAADDFINLLFGLKEPYQRNATGLFSRELVKRARKLKTGDGQYIWEPGMSGLANTILGRPYVQSEHVPATFTSGLYVGMFADFRAGYWIVDSLAMEVQRLLELFALKNQIGIVIRKETDGAPVLPEAFSRLKMG